MISDKDIDKALLANLTSEWRKIAFVVGSTMMQIDPTQRVGRDDLYFAKRIATLVELGLVNHNGDINRIRQCEVRLAIANDKIAELQA